MRKAKLDRKTNETAITVAVNLDGKGNGTIDTGVGFFDHMLDQLSRHSLIDLTIAAKGDVHIDDHHTVEDVGIAIGQALREALGDKTGIMRYGASQLVMDGTKSSVALDVSGRPFLVWRVDFTSAKIGNFDTELVREFFQAITMNAGITLHAETYYGDNNHHIAESLFKALARALRQAIEIDPRAADKVPSTKGVL